MVEAIDTKKTLANQLTKAISTLKDLAIDGRAIFTAMDKNGVIKDAMADDDRKSSFLDMTTPQQRILDSSLHKHKFAWEL